MPDIVFKMLTDEKVKDKNKTNEENGIINLKIMEYIKQRFNSSKNVLDCKLADAATKSGILEYISGKRIKKVY